MCLFSVIVENFHKPTIKNNTHNLSLRKKTLSETRFKEGGKQGLYQFGLNLCRLCAIGCKENALLFTHDRSPAAGMSVGGTQAPTEGAGMNGKVGYLVEGESCHLPTPNVDDPG